MGSIELLIEGEPASKANSRRIVRRGNRIASIKSAKALSYSDDFRAQCPKDLVPLMIKNGASANAVMGLKAKVLEQQQAYSKMAADDATTGSKNIETMKAKNDMIAGRLNTVMSLPDEQLGQGVAQAAQELAQQGLLDPQHAQLAAQLGQLPPAKIRSQLQLMEKGLSSQSQQIDQAAKQAQTAAENATTAQKQAETNYYAQNGGAPGVAAEVQQQNDWLKKNPGKGPSDFLLWKLQHSPTAMVMGNQLGGGGNQDALDFAANNYRMTGQMPAGFSRSPGTTSAIISRAAQLDQQAGGQGIAMNKTILNANKTSLDSLQKNFDQVNAFENTALKNMDLLQQTAAKIPDLGTKFANIPVRMISGNMIGTANMAAFKTALNTAQTEAAKVLNSSNASGVLSDSARHELQDLVDGNATYPALKASLDTLRQDMSNRHQSYQQQIADIQNRIKGASSNQQPTQNQNADPLGIR